MHYYSWDLYRTQPKNQNASTNSLWMHLKMVETNDSVKQSYYFLGGVMTQRWSTAWHMKQMLANQIPPLIIKWKTKWNKIELLALISWGWGWKEAEGHLLGREARRPARTWRGFLKRATLWGREEIDKQNKKLCRKRNKTEGAWVA